MIYTISIDIFKEEANVKMLDKIWLASEGRHKLYVYDEDTIDALMGSKWYDGLRAIEKDIIYNLIIETLQSNKNQKVQVIISSGKEGTYNIKHAYFFLTQPYLIYTENSLNDRYFFESITRNFLEGEKILNHFKEHWISYEMGGGATNIKNAILSKIKSLPNQDSKLLKCFVLIDSDKEYRDMDLKDDKIKLLEFFQSIGISYHVLEKREMENYIPDDIVEANFQNRDFITAYLKLEESEKDFIDLEKGFQENSKSLEKNKPEVFKFYKSLDENQIEALRYGLIKENKNFKTEFPKLFEKATKDGLLRRTKHQDDPKELLNILNKISEVL